MLNTNSILKMITISYIEVFSMELRTLHYFLAVAEEQNFTRAAQRLHVSQPNISRQIHDLESELGTQLFDRSQSQVQLTANGRYLQKMARQMVSLEDRAVQNIQKDNIGVSGHVRISAGEAHSMVTVAKAIANLTRRYPAIQVDIMSTNAEGVLQNLQAGLSDFGIVMGYLDDSRYQNLKLPELTRWGLLVRRDHQLVKQGFVRPQDFENLDLLMPVQKQSRGVVASWFKGYLQKAHIKGHYNLINNSTLLVQAGVGAALVLDRIINLTGSNLVFLPLYPQLNAVTTIVWQNNSQLSVPAQLLLDEIRKLVNQDNTK